MSDNKKIDIKMDNGKMGWMYTWIAIGFSLVAVFISLYYTGNDIKKEEIKIDANNKLNNNYEKENNANAGRIPAGDNNTSDNSQNNVATNTQKELSTSTKTINNNKQMKTVSIKTNMGEIEVELSIDTTPNTAENFKKLASSGFYNGTKFHRVISGFMIQGGDPLTKDNSKKNMWGTGDPGYKFADEIKSTNKNSSYTISMANSGPNTNGSQFFINTAENNFLDSKHTVFGKVTKGVEVVSKINNVDTDGMDRPLKDVVIESMSVK